MQNCWRMRISGKSDDYTMNRGFTLIELLVVAAIVSILAAILFPVFASAKAAAKKTKCISNLHQMGFAIAMYRSDADGVNPRHRFCPDRVGDELCTNLTSPTTWTGPNEIWWAPFDNSVAPDSSGPFLNWKSGFLAPYFKNEQIFKDPEEKQWQVGFAMSYITRGPMGRPESEMENPTVLQVWDHARTPGCADTRAGHLGPPWNIFPPSADTAHTHYPTRHSGGFVTLRHDSSAKWRKPASLVDADFISDLSAQ